MTTKKYFLIAAGAILFATMLTACEESLRNKKGEIEYSGDMSVFDLAVGDCVNEPKEDEFDEVPVVPCLKFHEYEVFSLVTYPSDEEDPYPQDDEMDEVSFELCHTDFYDYVGKSYYQSKLDITTFLPTVESWEEAGDRGITCLLYDMDNTYMRESMKGSRR